MNRRFFLLVALAAIATASLPVTAFAEEPGEPTAAEGTDEVLARIKAALAAGELPNVDDLLKGLELNLNAETRTTKMTMVVANPRRTKTMELHSFGRGNDEAAIEFTAPAREKGTKMYRKGDQMWMYMPAVSRTQKISGHMLRQGMMGSDMSYEDMSGNTEWQEDYDGTVEGSEDLNGRKHFKVVLKAKNDEVTYDKRVTFIDAETLIPTKQELYAISGLLVKTWEMSDVQEVEGRMYPMKMRVEDKLKEGTYTEITTTELQFGVDVPDEVFSVRWLERG